MSLVDTSSHPRSLMLFFTFYYLFCFVGIWKFDLFHSKDGYEHIDDLIAAE